MQKIRKIALWLTAIVYLAGISAFVTERHNGVLCNKIDVVIADSLAKRFLEPRDITNLLADRNLLALGEPITEINTDKIEKTVADNNMVKHCNVYTTIDGIVTVEIWQREPVVRIIDRNSKSYYLDVEGSVISMSDRFTPHVLVVNGYISTPFKLNKVENIYDKKYDKKARRLREIHEMALFIRQNEFWDSQIVQMYLNAKGEYEIIPRIGPHLIILGDASDFREKLDKLWVFYNNGLKNVGWNNYLKINLKYKDQIVCSKN